MNDNTTAAEDGGTTKTLRLVDTIHAQVRRSARANTTREITSQQLMAAIAETAVGRLEMLDPERIVIPDDRFRSPQTDTSDIELSIQRVGQIVPIMVRSNMTLVSGYRRVKACAALGVQVLAHVVDITDPQDAEIEEDRCRQSLTPYEMYRVTEALRPRLEDEAWARKLLGKRIEKAKSKGRVDDILADHVGISRGSLRKIREIIEAWQADPAKYGPIAAAMQKDPKVDRHFKAFKGLQQPGYDGPKVIAQLVDIEWQQAFAINPASVNAAFAAMGSPELVEGKGLILLPSSIKLLPDALTLLASSRTKVHHAFRGNAPEDAVWLLGTFSKDTKYEEDFLELLECACDDSYEEVLQTFANKFAYNSAVVRLMQALELPAVA